MCKKMRARQFVCVGLVESFEGLFLRSLIDAREGCARSYPPSCIGFCGLWFSWWTGVVSRDEPLWVCG